MTAIRALFVAAMFILVLVTVYGWGIALVMAVVAACGGAS